jgi:hypothetical protein
MPRHAAAIVILLLLGLAQVTIGCASSSPSSPVAKPAAPAPPPPLPTPPPMPRRNIAPPTATLPGDQIALEEFGRKFTLYLPPAWQAARARDVALTVHFHGAHWFAIQEHLRRGLTGPLLVYSPGEGSTIYRESFADPARFPQLIARVEQELKARGAPPAARVARVDVSCYSAGYGAVRELVKQPAAMALLRRVVLLDSMYASYDAGTTRPSAAHIDVWVPLARAAMNGDKTFVLTHSDVQTAPRYASTAECAAALLEKLGVPKRMLSTGSLPATTDVEFPLQYRADAGRFHVWGYGGADAAAHATHARHLADVWLALDAVGAP